MTDSTPPKPGSQPFALAYWMVKEIIKREWTETEQKGKGMHLKHAQILLRDYTMAEIRGCLLAMKAGRIPVGKYEIRWLTDIRQGEPPYIEQYKALALNPPPRWKTASYEAWAKEFDPHALAQALPQTEVSCPQPRYPPPTSPSSGRLHMARSTK